MGMPNSLGDFAWGCQIPCSVGDAKNTEGVPKSLGDLTRGCQILGGAGSPMTLGPEDPGPKDPSIGDPRTRGPRVLRAVLHCSS